MLSNYPPGVTGNEYAIAGGRDIEVEYECSYEAKMVTLHTALDLVQKSPTIELAMQELVAQSEVVDRTVCGFKGIVDAEEFDNTAVLTCPWCGVEREIPVYPETGENSE